MGWLEDAAQRDPYVQAVSAGPARSGGQSMGWVAPAIMAGGSVASSAMGGKAAKEAAKSQERSNAQALAFAREQEQTRKDQYSQAFNVWRNAQNIMRERYGLPPLPEMTAFPGSTQPGPAADPWMAQASGLASVAGKMFGPDSKVAAAVGRSPMATPGGVATVPVTLGQMMEAKAAPADPGSWNDWQQYRLG